MRITGRRQLASQSLSEVGVEKPSARASAAPARIVVERDVAAFSAIWPRTNSRAGSRHYAFQCADVLEAWCDTIGKSRAIEPLFVALLRSDGEPLLLLPLGIERRSGLRILSFLDGGVSDFNAPVMFTGALEWDRTTFRHVWREVEQSLPAFDVALLTKMPGRVENWPNPLCGLRTSVNGQGSYSIRLPTDWGASAPRILPNIADSRRRQRQLGRLGAVSFAVAKNLDEASSVLAAMMTMKRRKFIQADGCDWFAVSPGYADFYVTATHRLFRAGSVHLSALKVGDTIIAAHWGYVVGDRFYQLMPAFHNEWGYYAPGRLLNEFLMEWSAKQGLATFDFGWGDEPYKATYANAHQHLYDAVRPATTKGRAMGWAMGMRRHAIDTIRETRLFGVLKNIRRQLRKSRNSSDHERAGG